MKTKFGIGIVGLGTAVTPHLKSLKDLKDSIDIRGVFSRDSERRQAFARQHGLNPIDRIEDMLDDPQLDAVLLLTPPNARMELVRLAAAAGKHILMEKPLERSSAAGREIVEICEQAGVRLGVVFQHRFRPGALQLKQMLAQGSLGPIASFFLVVPWWRSAQYYSEPGRGTFAQDGGGVLITQAIHSLDLMLSLTGPVSEVQSMSGTSSLHAIEVEDFVSAGVRFANGALGSIMATTSAFPGGQETMVFNCAKASAQLSGSVLTVNWQDGRRETFGAEASTGAGDDRMAFPHDWHRSQIEDFVQSLSEARDPVSNGRSALQVHYLIDAMLESSRRGGLVKLTTHA